MNTISLNSIDFNLNSFSRNTYLKEPSDIQSIAYINISSPYNPNDLMTLTQNPITSLIIKHDDEVIYTLSDLNAQIISMDENFNTDKINVNINLQFN